MVPSYTKRNPRPISWLPVLAAYFIYLFANSICEAPLSPTITEHISLVTEWNPTCHSSFCTGLWLKSKGKPIKLALTKPSSTMSSIILFPPKILLCPDLPPVLRPLKDELMQRRAQLPAEQKQKSRVRLIPQWPFMELGIQGQSSQSP